MSKKGILLAGHGSTSHSNESAITMHAENLKKRGYENVYHGFKGYSKPYIQNVIQQMAEDGIDDVIVVPMFIARGHYTNDVVPKRVGLQKGEKEGTITINDSTVNIRITDAFGYHPMLSDIISKMVDEMNIKGKRNGIILIGHGSKGVENQNMVSINLDRLKDRYENVYMAFNEFNEPSIDDTLGSMCKDGVEHIIAIPLFVSPGEHTEKDLPEKLGLSDDRRTGSVKLNGREMTVSYGRPIGTRPEIVEIVGSLIEPYL